MQKSRKWIRERSPTHPNPNNILETTEQTPGRLKIPKNGSTRRPSWSSWSKTDQPAHPDGMPGPPTFNNNNNNNLNLQASLTLPTLSASPTQSAIPNQGLPTSAPLIPYGWPFHHHLRHHRRRDNLSTGTRKTSLPTSAPLMPYSRSFPKHLHRHRRRDKLIASMQKTSSPYGRSCCQHLHRQLSSTHQSMLRGQYHRWRQCLGPHHRHKPNQFVHGAYLKTLSKLETVLVGECVNTRLVPFRSLTSLQRSAGSL